MVGRSPESHFSNKKDEADAQIWGNKDRISEVSNLTKR